MIIELPKNATKKQVQAAIKKIQKSLQKNGRGNISKHFGVCKSEVDGLEFQKKIRSEWN